MDLPTPPVLYSADLVDCGILATLRAEDVAATFSAVLRRAGATIVKSVMHVFPGSGLTCVLILSESHAVIHTWPETGTVHLDIFSCSNRLESLEAIDELSQFFGGREVSVQEVRRVDGHQAPGLQQHARRGETGASPAALPTP